MAVGDDVPGIEEVDKSIRVGFTCALGGGSLVIGGVALHPCCRRGMARGVAEAYSASLENGATQLLQFLRLGWPPHSICCNEADTVLEVAYLVTQLLREHTLYLAACRKRRSAILRIEALRHQVAA